MKASTYIDEGIVDGGAVFTFVGMSNAGKSYISSKLAGEMGYEWLCIDDLIEAELGPELVRYGYRGIEDMAKWMGQPYEKRSPKNQAVYLELESKIMKSIIARLKNDPAANKLIIDTTGSVVHTGEEICSELSKVSKVIYFSVDEARIQKMYKNYIKYPKPVVWGDVFNANHGCKSDGEALERYYPKLLKRRSELYSEMAHLDIPREQLIDVSAQDFLKKVYVELNK